MQQHAPSTNSLDKIMKSRFMTHTYFECKVKIYNILLLQIIVTVTTLQVMLEQAVML